jgi:hypothetical protein
MLAIAPVAVINITSAGDTQTPMMTAFISRPLAEPVGDNLYRGERRSRQGEHVFVRRPTNLRKSCPTSNRSVGLGL